MIAIPNLILNENPFWALNVFKQTVETKYYVNADKYVK